MTLIRASLAGFVIDHDVIVVDEYWPGRPIDVEVGDTILLPSKTDFAGACAVLHEEPTPYLLAVAPGTTTLTVRNRERVHVIELRVSQRGFTGLARYRYLEKSDDE